VTAARRLLAMVAQASESSIGSKYASDGRCVDELTWHRNQLPIFYPKMLQLQRVFLLEAAVSSCIGRSIFLVLMMFLGKLTHAANHFVPGDGTVARDSAGVARKRSKPRKAKMPR